MASQDETYRHFIPKLDLSIERGTSMVPSDGRFHILKNGKIVESFRSKKLAEGKFKQLLAESGYQPETESIKKVDVVNESIERYAMAKDIFWAEGPKYRKRSGRGGRGGV